MKGAENIRIAGIQLRGNWDKSLNLSNAKRYIYQAAEAGAGVVCLPELFNTAYFCVERSTDYFSLAEEIPGPTTDDIRMAASDTRTVVICPIFERESASQGAFYNSAAVIGPDGEIIGVYRKTHIPSMDRRLSPEPRGDEKFYFKPGDLGFPVFKTPLGVNIGILICYDRHFPEAARILGLNGADILFVPTATTCMTRYLWDVELRAHAVFNHYYVCGVNKVNRDFGGSERFHAGNSMIIDPKGEILAEGSGAEEEVIVADVDLSVGENLRQMWGYYGNRRPECYSQLSVT